MNEEGEEEEEVEEEEEEEEEGGWIGIGIVYQLEFLSFRVNKFLWYACEACDHTRNFLA